MPERGIPGSDRAHGAVPPRAAGLQHDRVSAIPGHRQYSDFFVCFLEPTFLAKAQDYDRLITIAKGRKRMTYLYAVSPSLEAACLGLCAGAIFSGASAVGFMLFSRRSDLRSTLGKASG
jgi:hypothetical protein